MPTKRNYDGADREAAYDTADGRGKRSCDKSSVFEIEHIVEELYSQGCNSRRAMESSNEEIPEKKENADVKLPP